jgi:hypothetical protein
MAYITKSDIATFLGETLTAPQVAQVDALIPGVEAAANAHCNRRWGVSAPQVETFDGDRPIYLPSNSLITAITSITVGGTVLSTDEYYVYSGYVRLGSQASRGYRNVVITYTANIPLPAEVKQARIQWGAELFKAPKGTSQVVKSAQFGPGEVEYFDSGKDLSGVPKHVQTVLDRYRLMPV